MLVQAPRFSGTASGSARVVSREPEPRTAVETTAHPSPCPVSSGRLNSPGCICPVPVIPEHTTAAWGARWKNNLLFLKKPLLLPKERLQCLPWQAAAHSWEQAPLDAGSKPHHPREPRAALSPPSARAACGNQSPKPSVVLSPTPSSLAPACVPLWTLVCR